MLGLAAMWVGFFGACVLMVASTVHLFLAMNDIQREKFHITSLLGPKFASAPTFYTGKGRWHFSRFFISFPLALLALGLSFWGVWAVMGFRGTYLETIQDL